MIYKFAFSGLDETLKSAEVYDPIRKGIIDMDAANDLSLFKEVYSSERSLFRVY